MSTRTPLTILPITQVTVLPVAERERLVRTARRLSQFSLGWHLLEAGIAITAGVLANSIALTGFGADSLIEVAAALVVIWLMTHNRAGSSIAERRAQQLIAGSFLLLGIYIAAQSVRDLADLNHPATSWIGIALGIATLIAMPPLAAAKQRVGRALGSHATTSESRQNLLCAYASAALLVGLGANALVGAWWADPVAALAIGGIAIREARGAWLGDACDCC